MIKLAALKLPLVISILSLNLIWQTSALLSSEERGRRDVFLEKEAHEKSILEQVMLTQAHQQSSVKLHTVVTQHRSRLQPLNKHKTTNKENLHLSKQAEARQLRSHMRMPRQVIACNQEGRTNIQHWCEAAAKQQFVNGDNSFCSLCRYYVIRYMEDCLAYELSVNVSGVCIRPNGTVECIFDVIIAKEEIARCYSENEQGGVELSSSTALLLETLESNDTQCCQLFSTLNTSVPFDIQFTGEVEPELVRPWSESSCSNYPSLIGEDLCDALPTATTRPTTNPTTASEITGNLSQTPSTATVDDVTATLANTTNSAVDEHVNFTIIMTLCISILHALRL